MASFGNPPSFLPTKAAEASATFAGLLAAITLAVTIQLLSSRDGSTRTPLSFAIAPLTFITLLVTAYLYVRLAGRFDQTEAFMESLAMAGPDGMQALVDHPGNLFGQAHVTAALFATTGAMLATGAVATALLVTLVVHENTEDGAARSLASVAFYGAALVTVIFLVDGMYEIYSILRVEDVAQDGRSAAPGVARLPLAFFPLVVTPGIVIGGSLYWATRRLLSGIEHSSPWPAKIGLVAVALGWVGPVAWTTLLDSAQSFDLRGEWDILYCSLFQAELMAAIGVMAAIERHSGTTVRPQASESTHAARASRVLVGTRAGRRHRGDGRGYRA